MTDKKIPQHVAIIMDGNGRWANQRMLPRVVGHRYGAKVVREIVETAARSGVKCLSLFAFSVENWGRPKEEVKLLMSLLNRYLIKEKKPLDKENIRLIISGSISDLPPSTQDIIEETCGALAANTGMILNLCVSYGGKQEIVQAAKAFALMAKDDPSLIQKLDADNFSNYLPSNEHCGPIDMLIRTSGEKRISNFMMWQSAYAELYFTDKFWPDFHEADFKSALGWYQDRQRRFGKLMTETTQLESELRC